ncbi:MAG: hypothetical protein MUE33_04325 [Cytophagaceae bacterium]|jgi:hypothetical protein|nr:hypothetical protein [Cytophagaceae bacterium]
MKKISFVFLLFYFLVYSGFGQKANWEKVSMKYIQLPLKPVRPLAKNYTMDIILDAEGIQQGIIQSRQELVTSITKTNQILARQGKPQQVIPEDDSYYALIRESDDIKSLIKLEGCQEVSANYEFSIVVKVVGYNLINVTLKQSNTTVNGVTTPNYSYVVSAEYIVRFEVYDELNSLVRKEVVQRTSTPTTKTTKTFPTQIELETYWNTIVNRTTFLNQMDNELHNRAIQSTREQLNSELGYPTLERRIELATFDDTKQYNYKELRQAFSDASVGFNYMLTDKSKAFDYLRKAVTVWEKVVAEANPESKKARINGNIQQALWINIAKAYFFLEEWDKTNDYIIRLKAADKSGNVKRKLEEVENFKEDYEARIKANKI